MKPEPPSPNEWHKLGPFTVFDVETTGMSATRDRIVEIAAARVDLDGNRTRYRSLVNPERAIPSRISAIHHITDEMTKDAPTFREVGDAFLRFAEGSALVAHNARFDLAFLQESLFREGLPLWDGKTLDTIPLVKRAYPGLPSYSLRNLRMTFLLDEEVGPAHRAYADVEWTLSVLGMSLKRLLYLSPG